MSLQNQIQMLVKHIKDQWGLLEHNKVLFEIYEGKLLPYVERDLEKQLSPQTYQSAFHRIAPINVLKKITDKLSKIYSKPPSRTIVNGSERDQELLDWYVEKMQADSHWNLANELFNLHKNTWVEPFVDDGIPQMRAIPSDRFTVFSTNMNNPTKPTHLIKIMGAEKNGAKTEYVFAIYTKDEFTIVSEKGEVKIDKLIELGNTEGMNPYGVLPGVYINRSKHNLIPLPDTDVLRMSKLIPILISDLNAAVMYQCFSVVYGIDVDAENLKMAPNAFWSLKSDKTSDKTPQVGVVKPTVDIAEVQQLIQAELVFWLNTKNIRPGTVGGLAAENFASGISKIIDEMDTAEDRQRQVQYFKPAEESFWDTIIKKMHPFWVRNGLIETTQMFSPNASVNVEFTEQLPLVDRSQLLKDMIDEINAGLTTKDRAIKKLNPDLSSKEIEVLLSEIEADEIVEVRDVEPIQDRPGIMEDTDTRSMMLEQ